MKLIKPKLNFAGEVETVHNNTFHKKNASLCFAIFCENEKDYDKALCCAEELCEPIIYDDLEYKLYFPVQFRKQADDLEIAFSEVWKDYDFNAITEISEYDPEMLNELVSIEMESGD